MGQAPLAILTLGVCREVQEKKSSTMKHALLLAAIALGCDCSVASASDDAQSTRSVAIGPHNFTLPTGFEIELAAGPPMVLRPIHADFDDQGRLYVCESSGTNDKVEQQLADRPHWIVRLEDSNGDGRFDRSTRFAEGMMFPEGMLWLDGSIYVAAPPSIWKLTDTTGDGVADQREEWFQGKTLTGCANDLHGPYAGPDGWIYWCKGAFAQQTYPRPGKPPLVTRAAHIFRCRRDGSGVEPVVTGGMDNPVELVFTPGGERVFTTTFLQHPGGGRRDGLIHAIYGGVYGKQHDVLDGHPRTGDLMPPLTHFGAAAPSGLARYESSVFGDDYRDNLFAALFNLRKVTRHALSAEGATFASRDEDFVVCDNLNFHPTDVLEDADGSLLIIDTGGWYKLCCPSSQLWKPEILGGIYRVRRTGATPVADPRGLKIDWAAAAPAELGKLLADRRPAVRKRAVGVLAAQGAAATETLDKHLRTDKDPAARTQTVWTAARITSPEARALIRLALDDTDETVRQAAIHAASVARDRDAVPRLIALLQGPSLHNRRAAAEALGRIGDPSAVPALLALAGEQGDRALEHSATYALIEIAAPEPTRAGLAGSNSNARRAALLALAQMEGGNLEPYRVAELLDARDAQIQAAAAWIIEQHGDWGPLLAPWFESQLASGGLEGRSGELVARLCVRFAREGSLQGLLASRLTASPPGSPARQRILEVMSASGVKAMPSRWSAALAQVLRDDCDLTAAAIGVAKAIAKLGEGAEPLRDALLAAAGDEQLTAAVRIDALAALPEGAADLDGERFNFVRGQLGADSPVSIRIAAADVLAKSRLSDQQLLELTAAVRGAGPLEIERLLTPYTQCDNDKVASELIAALAASPALAAVKAETLAELFQNHSPQVQAQSQELYKLQAAGAQQRLARIEELLPLVAQGDVDRGRLVFNSQKAACAACHEIGYLGGTVGPDLTKIGQIRSERDLLESILFPSASFVRSYEPFTVATHDGKSFSGTLKKDAPDEVILAINANETVRIARDEIDQMEPSAVSIMPAGLDQQLSTQDLADLVAFLRACK